MTHYSIEDLSLPQQLQGGGFVLCTEGEGSVIVDMTRYNYRKGDMVIMLPFSVVQFVESSDNHACVISSVGNELFATIRMRGRSRYYLAISRNPCITLTRDEYNNIIHLRDLCEGYRVQESHLFSEEILDSLYRVLFYEVASLFNTRFPINVDLTTRDEIIFFTFLSQIFVQYRRHRDLEHYASRQQITASHLSKVIRRVSQRTATEWITNYTVNQIKARLLDREVTISEIVDEFRFPNNSYFTQYFKKYSGITPRRYRSSLKL